VIWANLVASILVATSLVLKLTWTKSATTGREGQRPRRPRLAVDMDEVIADSLTRHLLLYNRATGESLTPEIIREKGLKEAIPGEHRGIFDRLPHEDGFFEHLGVIENSQRALQWLSSEFDVFIVSAAMEVPRSFDAKFRWLQEHFPFIPTSNIVFCGDKEIIDADYLIDDRSRHFARFRGTGILFTAPHNARERAKLRAGNWDAVLAIVMSKHPALAAPQFSQTEIANAAQELAINNIKGIRAM
jgi:5'(3')-deoxyribonucleotidase